MQPNSSISTSTHSDDSFIDKKYLFAFILVTSLFFMWAFAHNLNDILIRQFQKALALSRGQSSFIQVAFYLGYFMAAIPAGLVMRRVGYKNGILLGLMLYAFGAMLFYPAADARSYPFFLLALFVIATGATFLETAANPYVIALGSSETSAQRLNLAQSFNGLGATAAPFLGGLLIFSGVEHSAEALSSMTPAALDAYRIQEASMVQLPYLILAACVSLLAVVIFFVKFPDVVETESDTQSQSGLRGAIRHKHLRAAVIAQLFYVGAQVGIWSYFIDFTKDMSPVTPEKTAAFWLSVSLFTFMIGRFLGTFLLRYFRPERLLAIYACACIILCFLATTLSGMQAIIVYGATSFFMSIMFPTIFALGVKDLGADTKLASSLIIMAIIGGALMPPIMGYVTDLYSIQTAVIAPMLCFVVVLYFAVRGHKVR